MSLQPRFSIIVPHLDAPLADRVLLLALEQAEVNGGEVIVVGMEREGHVRLDPWRGRKHADERLRLIDSDRPLYPGVARNLAASAARSDKLLFIDADALPRPGWAAAMADALDDHRFVGGAVEFGAANEHMLADNVAAFFDLTPDRRRGDADTICSVNMGMRRGLFERLGGFDERLETAEDLDLVLRAASLGVRPIFEPAAVVLHLPCRDSREAVEEHARAWAAGSALVRARRGAPLMPGPLFSQAALRLFGPLLALGAALATLWIARKSLDRPLGLLGPVYRSRRAWFRQAARTLREART